MTPAKQRAIDVIAKELRGASPSARDRADRILDAVCEAVREQASGRVDGSAGPSDPRAVFTSPGQSLDDKGKAAPAWSIPATCTHINRAPLRGCGWCVSARSDLLEAERDELREHLQCEIADTHNMCNERDEARRELAEASREVARAERDIVSFGRAAGRARNRVSTLEAALRPFARYAEVWDLNKARAKFESSWSLFDAQDRGRGCNLPQLKLANVRAARAALVGEDALSASPSTRGSASALLAEGPGSTPGARSEIESVRVVGVAQDEHLHDLRIWQLDGSGTGLLGRDHKGPVHWPAACCTLLPGPPSPLRDKVAAAIARAKGAQP